MMKHITALGMVLAAGTALAAVDYQIPSANGGKEGVTVDFTRTAGKIRRGLHSSGWGGQLTGPQSGYYTDVKPLGMKAARTHDWALLNPGQRMLDLHFIFPLLHADTEDPKNYFFGPTDEILEMTIEDLGLDVLYRMGTSIESVNARRKGVSGSPSAGDAVKVSRPPRYYNSVEPADWDQFAKAQAKIIHHYLDGWNNGYHWGEKMQYWELWNEPNDQPGGSWIVKSGERDRQLNFEAYDRFFVHVLKRLKAEFPQLKFGGPACCSCDIPFLTRLLNHCKAEGYTPDFVSWHGYGSDPKEMLSQPERVRKLLDDLGFTKTEIMINEWHWYPNNWWGKFNFSEGGMRTIQDPLTGVCSVNAAIYAQQVILGLQSTCLDQSYFYGCGHQTGSNWGYRGPYGELGKHWYALKTVGDIFAACDEFVETEIWQTSPPVRAFGALSRDGKKAHLVVSNYMGVQKEFEVLAKGLAEKPLIAVWVLDSTRNNVELDPKTIRREGELIFLPKPDAQSISYRMEFAW